MEIQRPAEIEQTSMKIIREELAAGNIRLPEETAPVILRMIHSTADFDYAANVRITPGAVPKAVEALRQGTVIVTDTNMALAGISRTAMEKLGCRAVCLMGDPKVGKEAKERGCTRATVSMEQAAANYPGCICAVGNAPTALFEIDRQIRKGFRPALVIAVPVGFVNVTEAKETILETCEKYEIPAIVSLGRKGGSTVAAAACNALLYMAADMADPLKRGW